MSGLYQRSLQELSRQDKRGGGGRNSPYTVGRLGTWSYTIWILWPDNLPSILTIHVLLDWKTKRPSLTSRPSSDDKWQHDLYSNSSSRDVRGKQSASDIPTQKLLVEGLHYEITNAELEVRFRSIFEVGDGNRRGWLQSNLFSGFFTFYSSSWFTVLLITFTPSIYRVSFNKWVQRKNALLGYALTSLKRRDV